MPFIDYLRSLCGDGGDGPKVAFDYTRFTRFLNWYTVFWTGVFLAVVMGLYVLADLLTP